MDADRLKGALDHLDPENDAHWTTAGKPRMDALEIAYAVGADDPLEEVDLTRRQVETAVPDFDRDVAHMNKIAVEFEGTRDEDADAPEEQGDDETDNDVGPDETVIEEDKDVGASDGETETEDDEGLPKEEGPEELSEEEDPSTPDPVITLEDEVLKSSEVVQVEVDQDKADKEALRAELTEELRELSLKRAAALEVKSEASLALDRFDADIDKVNDRLQGEVGPIPLSTAIRDFIDSAHRERQRRAGIMVTQVASPKSPIDKALNHTGRGRGTKRVVRRPLGK